MPWQRQFPCLLQSAGAWNMDPISSLETAWTTHIIMVSGDRLDHTHSHGDSLDHTHPRGLWRQPGPHISTVSGISTCHRQASAGITGQGYQHGLRRQHWSLTTTWPQQQQSAHTSIRLQIKSQTKDACMAFSGNSDQGHQHGSQLL